MSAPDTTTAPEASSAMHGSVTPITDAAWESYNRGACGLHFIAHKMRQLEADQQTLRRLLAFLYAGGAGLYRDDGELQDNRAHPLIDFKRDTPGAIERKMEARGWAVIQSQNAAGQATAK